MSNSNPSSGITLSPEQEQVVSLRGRHLQVIACAGSGKTESISRRVAALIVEGEPPASIVAFTFTEREDLGLGDLGHRHWQTIGDFIHAVDVVGNELIDPDSLKDTPFGQCYQAYVDTLDRHRVLTFSLIISKAVEALADPAVFARVHSPLRHLIVDEYQDINPAQERLIRLLSTDPVQLCVAGDDDQSIYQWRGPVVDAPACSCNRSQVFSHRSMSPISVASSVTPDYHPTSKRSQGPTAASDPCPAFRSQPPPRG